MNINTKLDNVDLFITYVNGCKSDIKDALIAKGVEMSVEDTLDVFAAKVASITGITEAIVEGLFDTLNGEAIAGNYNAKYDATIADKEAIRLSIIDKGIATPIDTHLQDYPAKIGEIITGIPESIINPILNEINGEVIAGDYNVKSAVTLADKETIRQAIIAKGVAVPVETTLASYAIKVSEIETGFNIDTTLEMSQIAYNNLELKDLKTIYICEQ